MDFSKGDLVNLKSGGPCMSVMNTDSGFVTCVWFTDEDRLLDARFTPECLEKWEEEKRLTL